MCRKESQNPGLVSCGLGPVQFVNGNADADAAVNQCHCLRLDSFIECIHSHKVHSVAMAYKHLLYLIMQGLFFIYFYKSSLEIKKMKS